MRQRFLWVIAIGWVVFRAICGPAWCADIAVLGDNAVQDCAGRRINTEKPFSRIISLYGAHTENLAALGALDQLIGVAPRGNQLAEVDKPVFSVHDGPERFLAARPDLVLVRPMHDRGYAALMSRLESFGVVVASLQPGSISEMKLYWHVLGHLTGRQQSVASMVRRFEAGVRAARAVSSDISPRKKVYFEAIHKPFKTFTPGAMPLFALSCAGGVNIAQEAKSVRGTNIAGYSKERILAHAEDIDVYLAQKGVMNPIEMADIVNEPGFGAIKAVRNGLICLVDETIVSRPTLALLQGICRIGECLYPEQFDAATRERIIHP